jgi:integrase
MKKIYEYIYRHGATHCVRMRIPKELKWAYPEAQDERLVNLRTGDPAEAKKRSYAVIARIQAEFADKRLQRELSRASLSPKRIGKLTDAELALVGGFYKRSVLQTDQARRQAGLDDEEFDELGRELASQRAELARLLAQGKTQPILGVLKTVLHLCGLDFQPRAEEASRAGFVFLRAVVDTLDKQLQRQAGGIVDTDTVAPPVAHPLAVIAPECAPVELLGPSWDGIFTLWCQHGERRPKSSITTYRTPWWALERFAASKKVLHPEGVTATMMSDFVEDMKKRGLATATINERLFKVRYIFKVGKGKHKLTHNPAAETLGVVESTTNGDERARVALNSQDIDLLFRSPIFMEHIRSQGQTGEASYWAPAIMLHSAMRPEEVAGLALRDICHDPIVGWYFDLYHRTEASEQHLPVEERVPDRYWRKLKNNASIRRVPIAPALIGLGLLRYVDWVRAQGSLVLFPTLKKDGQGKLDGALIKFFSRYLRAIGITDKKKTLYSLRHSMKNQMESAKVNIRHQKRIMGHRLGEGNSEDYGDVQLPYEHTVEHFREIKFPAIPALPWQPGQGTVRRVKRPTKHGATTP